MKTLLKYLKPYYLRMSVGLFIKIMATVAELTLPYILSHILKSVVVTGDVKQIVFWGMSMVLFSGIACLGNIIANRMAVRVSCNFSQAIRHDLFDKMLHLSSAQTDRFTVASLESRITTDTYHIHHFISMMQRMGVRAPIMLIGGVAITLIMDQYLSLVMLAIAPFVFIIIFFISRKGIPLYGKVQKSVDRMVRVVREDVQGIRVIKALSKDEYERRRYDKVNMELVKDEKRAGITMGLVHPIMTLLMNFGIIAVIVMSVARVQNRLSDPETVIAFMQYFTQISMAMMSITRIFTMCSKSFASAKRIEEVLLCEDELPIHSEEEYPAKEDSDFIEFEHVSFSYNGKRDNVSDIRFSLKKGQHLGIIGATGSGKSTIVKLLMRFYDIGHGAIRIDGRDIRTIEKEELYGMFGVALQNDFLYNDTIMENIKFGRELTTEQVEEAAKIAQAHDFITSFEDGYDHMLSQKATNISGGQKQRLLISRAIAAKPKILILDDSSSALDYKTEANLRKALQENMAEMTTITVAQRVSAVKSCDLILVIDEGNIIGMGTHDSLLATCVEYKEISDSQMGGAFVD